VCTWLKCLSYKYSSILLNKKWLNKLQNFLCLTNPPQGDNIKHHWWNNKNKCHLVMLNVFYTNLYRRSHTSQTFASHDLVLEIVWFFFFFFFFFTDVMHLKHVWNVYSQDERCSSFSYCMKKNRMFKCVSYVFLNTQHTYVKNMNLWKTNFTWFSLPNRKMQSLWYKGFYTS
jgi:hypothetical protein